MPAQIDPNPVSNPGMELECVNCKGMLDAGLITTPTDPWIWHVPEGNGPDGQGTEVGGFDDEDKTRPLETNAKHPHCPVCGSHAVRVLKTINSGSKRDDNGTDTP